MLSQNKLGKTQARAKGIMNKKEKLLKIINSLTELSKDFVEDKVINTFSAIADLVQMLSEYGCENDSIIHTLTHYGFTKEQIAEWYGIGE
jgi:hypothetical protein